MPITVVDSQSRRMAEIIRDSMASSRKIRVIRVSRFIIVFEWKLMYREEAISGAIDEIIGPATDQNQDIIVDRLLAKSYGIKYRIPWREGLDETHKLSLDGNDWCNNVIHWIAFKVKFISQSLCLWQDEPVNTEEPRRVDGVRLFRINADRIANEDLYASSLDPTPDFRNRTFYLDPDGHTRGVSNILDTLLIILRSQCYKTLHHEMRF